MKKTNRLLVVDDTTANRLIVKSIAIELGIEFYEATNGKEAIDLLDTKNVDLILMDIEMPVMSGIETIEFIRYKFAYPNNETPIVVLTAHDKEEFAEMYSNIKYDGIVTKPYTLDKLKDVILSWMRQ